MAAHLIDLLALFFSGGAIYSLASGLMIYAVISFSLLIIFSAISEAKKLEKKERLAFSDFK